ncbi:DUF1223 domain-containing protein [Methylobacterium sp. JK268]
MLLRLRHLPVLAAFAVGWAIAPAAAADRPLVLELFTSQGCSSCPPADAYLGELAASRPDLLPLTFHVTYWNGLGWQDPFSLPEATDRQAAYATRFDGVSFTPQLVVDGALSVVGSDREAAAGAIAQARAALPASPAASLRRRGGDLAVAVGEGAGRGRLLLVGFDHAHRTAVRRGENGGRTLVEANVVRGIREIGAWTGARVEGLHAAPPGEDAALLLQAPDGRILAAARLDPAS